MLKPGTGIISLNLLVSILHFPHGRAERMMGLKEGHGFPPLDQNQRTDLPRRCRNMYVRLPISVMHVYGSLRTVAITLWCLTVHLWVGSLPSPNSSRPEIKDRWGRNARCLLVSSQSYLDIVNSFYCQKQQEILILGVIAPTVAGDELETVKMS